MKKVKALTVTDYKALPKSEREVYGLYRKPDAMLFTFLRDNDGWDGFEKYVRKEYPIQAWFREDVLFWFSCQYSKLKSVKRSISIFIKPSHPRYRNSYPRHAYKDVDNIIEDGLFALLKDFWYEECWPTSIVSWDSDDEHRRIYRWMQDTVELIEVVLPKLESEYDEELGIANKSPLSYSKAYAKTNLIEKRIKDLKNKLLHEIIDNREWMWT